MLARKTKKKANIALIIGALVVIGIIVGISYYFRPPKEKNYVRIYFTKEEKLVAVERRLLNENPALFALKELLAGPKKEEIEKGIFTEIPSMVSANIISIKNGAITINFNKRLAEYGGGTSRVQALVAQIVYTMTEIPGIKKVRILIDGKSEIFLGGEGYMIDRSLSRNDVSL